MKTNFKGQHYKTGKPIDIRVNGGMIVEVKESLAAEGEFHLAPGLVDLQVNGFKGIDFNSGLLTADEVCELTCFLWEAGVTTYFPTLITNSDEGIVEAIEAIVAACKADERVNASIGGIHLEGPFLSAEDGPRGAHPLKHIKAPDWELFRSWQKLAEGRIQLMTMAPEWPEAEGFIKKCTASGVLVSIGHTAASPLQIQTAIGAGATMSTHLGNATHLSLPRHDNYIWEQLASDKLWASIIADGFHLPKAMLEIFVKVKEGRCILVSDCTKFAGLAPGSYDSHIGGQIELNKEGRLFMKKEPKMLAGSAQSLAWCVDHLTNSGILPLSEALDMASVKPMEWLGANKTLGLTKGASADFIVFERRANTIEIVRTVKSGAVVYQG
ncbi:N-acetylglucosamine-6-phosphate deacetylase [Zobellia sp. OII3]|uniref:N-acetylglucosamine-6-phosphate deacetylase n=1 Tax=Zobellia sp. OII3 TaxID=2034520 RepID=UPI000B530E6B|nr:amidohydrolase family protein [Zobellia sp. OII3]OWW23349.1 N-acetylglucosamine-6-phosphate deacetylase [Zobellia sp. OII3]